MGPVSVVLFTPPFDVHLSLPKIIDNLAVEHLTSEYSIEDLFVPILPGDAWLDEQVIDPDSPKPIPDRLGSEFRAII